MVETARKQNHIALPLREGITLAAPTQARFESARIGMHRDEEKPGIQLEPRGKREYTDLKAVKPIE